MNLSSISIVIPFKDEKRRLPDGLGLIFAYLSKNVTDFEIVLVDDGSRDDYRSAIGEYFSDKRVKLLIHNENQGKGAAVRTGMLAATKSLRLFSDADLATPISELEKLVARLNDKQCDVVIGSRALPDSVIKTPQPFFRVLIGKTGNLLVRLITGMRYKDTQCGFKLFTASAAQQLFSEQKFPRWSFDIEILYRAKLKNLKVCEVGVEWSDVAGSKVHPIRDALKVLADVIKIRKYLGK